MPLTKTRCPMCHTMVTGIHQETRGTHTVWRDASGWKVERGAGSKEVCATCSGTGRQVSVETDDDGQIDQGLSYNVACDDCDGEG